MSRRTENLSLYLLLAVAALRPLISETYRSSRTGIEAALTQLTDPLPATTLGFDAVIILAALVWSLGKLSGRSGRYRRTGLEAGVLLVAVAGIVSCLVAGHRRVAINATVDWLCLPLLTIVLVQLLRDSRRIRLTLCVILSTAAVQAYECFNQVFDTFTETKRLYQENKEEFWATAGVEPDSPQVALFERRLEGREATGYLTHSNVTGAYLAMTGLAGLALGWNWWRAAKVPVHRRYAVFAMLAAAAMFAAAGLTRSRGALLAGLIALGVWMLRLRLGKWFERHRRGSFVVGWGLVVAAIAAGIGHGLYHGGLPGASLNFRWQYWTASAEMFRDYWTTGVGRENFGNHYLRYKTIQSAEEVGNPHNMLVTAATEWGVLGLAGMVAMLLGGSWASVRPGRPRGRSEAEHERSLAGWGVAVAVGVFFVRLFLLGSRQPAYLVYVTLLPLIIWSAAYCAFCNGSRRIGLVPDGALVRLTVGVNCCLLAFLLQETIDFALIVPGAATTFFALLAVPIAIRSNNADAPGPSSSAARRAVWPIMLAAALILHLGWVLRPVARSGAALRDARNLADRTVAGGYPVQPAYLAFMQAAQVDGLDPTPRAEAAAFLMSYAEVAGDRDETVARAFELIDTAIELNPHSTSLHRRKMRMCRWASRTTGDAGYLRRAVEPAQRIVDLYPQSPSAHADLGGLLFEVGRDSLDADFLSQAKEHLSRALDLEESRPSWEVLRRMPEPKRQALRQRIAETSALLEKQE